MEIPPDRHSVACPKVFPELRPIAGNLLPVIPDPGRSSRISRRSPWISWAGADLTNRSVAHAMTSTEGP